MDTGYEIRLFLGKAILVIATGILIFFFLFGAFVCCNLARAEEIWKVTAYCACEKCCGKSDGITASGKKARYGMVACNWLKFGTVLQIKGLGNFVVQDRGAKSLFGTFKNPIRHIDVYLPTHAQALKFGVKYLQVEVL